MTLPRFSAVGHPKRSSCRPKSRGRPNRPPKIRPTKDMRGSYAAGVATATAVDADHPLAKYLRPPPPVAVRQSAGRRCGKGGRGRAASVVAENDRPP